jgi:hypothetical protein
MNAIKTLLAVSVLAAAGAANAATVATFDVAVNGVISGALNGTLTGRPGGSATLDSSGVYTQNVIIHSVIGPGLSDVDLNATTIYSGALTGNSLAWTTGTNVINLCSIVTPGQPLNSVTCNGTQQGTTLPSAVQQNPIVFGITSVGDVTILTGHSFDAVNNITQDTTFTLTATSVPTPAVPVPAAAWLFGSGLLGLAGTARRRRAA